MSGEQIYNSLCKASDLDAAVSRLSREDLATVAEYISDQEPFGGVPAQVFGVVTAKLNPPKRKRKGVQS